MCPSNQNVQWRHAVQRVGALQENEIPPAAAAYSNVYTHLLDCASVIDSHIRVWRQ